jgi:hypothetical protein
MYLIFSPLNISLSLSLERSIGHTPYDCVVGQNTATFHLSSQRERKKRQHCNKLNLALMCSVLLFRQYIYACKMSIYIQQACYICTGVLRCLRRARWPGRRGFRCRQAGQERRCRARRRRHCDEPAPTARGGIVVNDAAGQNKW